MEMDLSEFRARLNAVDNKLAALFLQRMDIVGELARYKQQTGRPIVNEQWENATVERLTAELDQPRREAMLLLYHTVFELSHAYQQQLAAAGARYGLLGENLAASFAAPMQAALGNRRYQLFNIDPEHLERFLQSDFDGVNVTVPYNVEIMKYCAELSETAKRIGSVNTVLKRDGLLYGHNTDYFGFGWLLGYSGLTLCGKKVLIFGGGGAGQTVRAAARDMSASEVVVVTRDGEDNYDNLQRHYDAQVIVNATPVGMFPHNGERLIDLACFTGCESVIDLVCNPAVTPLLFDARRLGIPCTNGLPMLAAQSARSIELFTGSLLPKEKITTAVQTFERRQRNLCLIGMPGCGKSHCAAALGRLLHRQVYDTDEMVKAACGLSARECRRQRGEAAFRDLETAAAAEVGKKWGVVIATGGGIVTREENLPLLQQNSTVLFINAPLQSLSTYGRPLSEGRGALERLYAERLPLYRAACDLEIAAGDSPEQTAAAILRVLGDGYEGADS